MKRHAYTTPSAEVVELKTNLTLLTGSLNDITEIVGGDIELGGGGDGTEFSIPQSHELDEFLEFDDLSKFNEF